MEDKIKDVLANCLAVTHDEVISEANLVDDLGADSLDQVEIAMTLEEDFGIEIPDSAWDNEVKTVGDLTNLVTQLVANKK